MISALKQFVRTLAVLRHPESHAALIELVADVRLRQLIMREHPGLVIEKGVIAIGYSSPRLKAGKARVSQGTVLSFGDDVTGFGDICIGDNTWIGQHNNLRASRDASIEIGNDCLISQFCSLIGANHRIDLNLPIIQQPLAVDRLGVRLGNGVWLGAGVTVLPGVTIGHGAVIGAGSVVTTNVPDNEIWLGVPARKHGIRL
jgi:acetyltransferase-like isoleucine patch superfamily enzyme